MLFLLRKIRRKLMGKNKITTYLMYAIGEILLVVLGIIIAVQLNNWNQERKAKEAEKVLLKEVLNAIQSDSLAVVQTINLVNMAYQIHQDLFQVKNNEMPVESLQELNLLRRSIPFGIITSTNYPNLASEVLDNQVKQRVLEYYRIGETWQFVVTNYNEFIEVEVRSLLRENRLLNYGAEFQHDTFNGSWMINIPELAKSLHEKDIQQVLFEASVKTRGAHIFGPQIMECQENLKKEIRRILQE